MIPDLDHLNPEQFDAYLTGALPDEERAGLDSHLAACPACTAALVTVNTTDDRVRRLFAVARPTAGFEDRLIRNFRSSNPRRFAAAPRLLHAASAAAAVLAVGTIGYFGANALSISRSNPRIQLASNLRQIGQETQLGLQDGSAAPAGTASLRAGEMSTFFARKPVQQLPELRFSTPVGDRLVLSRTAGVNKSEPAPAPPVLMAFRPTDLAERETHATGLASDTESLADADDAGRISTNTSANESSASLGGMERLRHEPESVKDVPVNTPSPALDAKVASAGAAPAVPVPPLALPRPATTQPQTARVIRNGTMEFEVDRFESAVATLTKITQQAGGFVATTNSDTLPNGKVKGLVVLRVPPDRLDPLVQSLRALGDLKSQQISAEDVTKEYTDLQSELAADHAMQDRLLELIKSGNGQIKDLLSVEKELAVWKGKIEKAEGEIRYYDNLVAMSTLNITLEERDIQTPATVLEKETADLAIEAEDVEHNYAEAMNAVKAVKGRIVESELKRYDAGQLAARIVADVPSESSGSVMDRLKQLGRVARLQVSVQQTDVSSTDASQNLGAAAPQAKQQPTRLLLSLYNLANVAPRRTTTMTLATSDVQTAAAALLDQVAKLGGRVVSSAVNRDDPNHATASITLELPPEKIDAATSALTAGGDVLKLTTTENPDTQNTTESKQGITLQLVSLASVSPRETIQQGLAAPAVPAAYHRIFDAAAAAGATIRTAQLDESDPQNITGTLQFDLLRTQTGPMDAAIAAAGQTISRSSARSDATENIVDSKIGLQLTLTQADRLPPRQSTTLQLQVSDAAQAAASARALAQSAGGQVLAAAVSKDAAGQQTAKVQLDVSMEKSNELLAQLRSAATLIAIDSAQDPRAPDGPLARAHFDLTYTTGSTLIADNSGILATLRNGFATSIAGLLWSLQMLVVGLCLIGPWVGLIWIAWKLWRRTKGGTAAQAE